MKLCQCGNGVASNARACPSCGHRFTSPVVKILGIGFLILFGFVLIMVISYGSPQTSPSSITSPSEIKRVLKTGNEANDRLLSLPESQQESTLGEIVGEGCVGNREFYMGMDKKHDAFWSIGCTSGQDFEVEIHPDASGSTKVLACSILKAVADVDCFKKFANQ